MKQVKKEDGIVWDKKKIILFCVIGVILLALAFNYKTAILGESLIPNQAKQLRQIKSVSTQDLSNGIKQSIQNNVNNLKNEAQSLDVAEIASSSPQVQKVLNDLRSLKDLPKNQLKNACENLCGRL